MTGIIRMPGMTKVTGMTGITRLTDMTRDAWDSCDDSISRL